MDSTAATEIRPTVAPPFNGPMGTDANTNLQSYWPVVHSVQPPAQNPRNSLWIAYHVIDLVVKTIATAMLIGVLIISVLQYNLMMELLYNDRRWLPVRVTMDTYYGTSTNPYYVKVDQ